MKTLLLALSLFSALPSYAVECTAQCIGLSAKYLEIERRLGPEASQSSELSEAAALGVNNFSVEISANDPELATANAAQACLYSSLKENAAEVLFTGAISCDETPATSPSRLQDEDCTQRSWPSDRKYD